MNRNFFVQLRRFFKGLIAFVLAFLVASIGHFLSTPITLASSTENTSNNQNRQEYLSAEAVPPRSKILEAIGSVSSKFGDDPLYLEKIQTVGKALVFDWQGIQSLPSQISKSGKRTAIKVYCGTNAFLGLPCVVTDEGKIVSAPVSNQIVQTPSSTPVSVVINQQIDNSTINFDSITESLQDIIGSVSSSSPVYNVFNTYCTTTITNSTTTNTSGGSSSGGSSGSGSTGSFTDGDYTGAIATNPVSTAPSTYDQASAFVPRRLYAGQGISLSGSAGLITITNTGLLSLPQDLSSTSSPTFARVNTNSVSVGGETINDFTGTGLEVVNGRLNVTIRGGGDSGGSSGSNSDANTLDGLVPGDFLRSNVSDSYSSGILCFDSGTTLRMCAGSTLEVLGNVIGLSSGGGSGTSSAYFTVGSTASTTCGTFAVIGDSFMCGSLKLSNPITNAIVVGSSNTVTGLDSVVYGSGNSASGNCTYAFGRLNTVSGADSLALGYSNTAALCGSTAVGFDNTASGQSSFAGGYSSTASGSYGLALGYCAFATGATSSSAVGNKVCATGSGSSVFGGDGSGFFVNNTACSTLLGPRQGSSVHILASGEVLLPYVTATSTTATSTLPRLYVNELIVTGTADVGCLTGNSSLTFSTTTPTLSVGTTTSTSSAVLMVDGATCITSSNGAVVMGDTFGNSRGANSLDIQSFRGNVATNVASGICSVAVGLKNQASNTGSIAYGDGNISSGLVSVAVGTQNTSSGTGSVVFGRTSCASGTNSSAFGNCICALADNASIFGGSGTNVFANSCEFSTMIGPTPSAFIHILCTGETKLPYLTTTDSNSTSTFAGPVTFSGDICVMGNAYIPSLIGASNAGTSSAYFTVGTTTATPPSGSCLYVLGGLSLGCYGSGAAILGDTSGNTRGTSSIDFQSGRALSSQVASGACSIAIGYSNTASGNYSSAFGIRNVANATGASVFGGGLGTTTNAVAGSTMIGPCQGSTIHILSTGEVRLPYITATTTSISCLPTLHVTDLCVTNSADIANLLVSNFTPTTTPYLAVGTTTCPPEGSVLFVDGGLNIKNSNGSVLIGDTSSTTRGNYAIDLQTLRSSTTGCIASGACSIAIGNNVSAFGTREINIGSNNCVDQTVNALGRVTIGYCNQNLGFGYDNTDVSGVVVGACNKSTSTWPYVPNSIFGIRNSTGGVANVLIGYSNVSSGGCSIGVGWDNIFSACSSVFGRSNIGSGCSIIYGTNNTICRGGFGAGHMAVGFGFNNCALVGQSDVMIFGSCNRVCGDDAMAFGFKSIIDSGACAIVFGNCAQATNTAALAMGQSVCVSGLCAFGIGNSNVSCGTCAGSIGSFNCACAADSYAFGSKNKAICQFATAFGLNNISCATSATAFGDQNSIFGCESSAFGRYNCIQNTTCFGSAFGYCNILNAPYTSGFGYRTYANASGASVFGGGGSASSTAFLLNDTASSTLIGPQQGSTIHILSTGEVRLPYLTGTSTATSTLAGALGIGTSTADIYALNVGGDINYTGTLYNNGVAFEAGSGTVNSGTTGQVAYYGANGTAVSGTSTLFLSGEKVGIGTTNITNILTVRDPNDAFDHNILGLFANNLSQGIEIGYNTITSAGTSPDVSLSIRSKGSSPLVLQPSGYCNVGIGTTTPGYKLTVAGDVNYTGTLYQNGVAVGSGSGTVNSGNTGQVAYYASDGSVVSGTSTLTLGYSTSTLSSNLVITGNFLPSADNTYSLGASTTAWKDVFVGPGSLYINGKKVLEESGGEIVVSADPDQTLTLKTSGDGDVDINPSGTGQVLLKGNVRLNSGYAFNMSDNSAIPFTGGVKADNITIKSNLICANNLNGGISLHATGTGGVYVETGKFGVGTTSPSHCLTVAGDINYTGTLYQNGVAVGSGSGTVNSGNTGQVAYYAGNGTAVSGTSTLFISGENVGIGTTNPSYKLDICGDLGTGGGKGIHVQNTNSNGYSELVFDNNVTEVSGGFVFGYGGTATANPDQAYFWNRKNAALLYGTNGLERMRITGGGNVGVGTTSPSHLLTVAGDINYTGTLYQNGVEVGVGGGSGTVNSGTAGQVAYYAGNGTAVSGTSTMTFENNRVKIGTGSTCCAALNIFSSNATGCSALSLTAGQTNLGGGGNQIIFGYNCTNACTNHAIKTRHDTTSAGGNSIDFYTWKYGTDALTDVGTCHVLSLTGCGYVGIGITNPTLPLQLPSTVGAKIGLYGCTYGLGIGNNLVQLYAAGTGDRVGIGYGGSASFTEVLTVAGSGKVGIGCTSPGQKLTVAGDIGLSGILCFATTSKIISVGNTNTNSGNYSIAIGNSTCACGTCAVSVGNVSKAMSNNSLAFGLCTCASAIGASVFGGDGTALFANTTTCSTMIGPRNTAAIQICANGSASVVQFHGYGAGTPELLADGVLSVSSDERLKDIQGNFDRGLDEIMQLDPIIYSWKKETPFYGNGEEYAGFSAQDVEEVIPEAVAEDSRGYLSLNTKPIIATLVNAMKEIGQYFVDGTLRIGRIVSDVIEGQVVKTKKLETEEICVDDVCIDKESLKALLIEAGARNNTEEEDTSSGGGSTTEEVVDTSTSTEEIIDDTATSTDSGVSEEDVSNDPSGEGSVEDTSTSTEGESGAGETLEEEPVVEEEVVEEPASEEPIIEEEPEPEPDPEPEPAPEEPVADTPSE